MSVCGWVAEWVGGWSGVGGGEVTCPRRSGWRIRWPNKWVDFVMTTPFENCYVIDYTLPVLDENRPVLDENRPVLDENRSVIDYAFPVLDENPPVLDENRSKYTIFSTRTILYLSRLRQRKRGVGGGGGGKMGGWLSAGPEVPHAPPLSHHHHTTPTS